MHPLTRTAAAVLAALALLVASTTAAHAGTKPRIDLHGDGLGAYVVDGHGTAHLAGHVVGKPVGSEPYTATLAALDGSLPGPGTCEPATATLEVSGSRRDHLHLTATGEVCGEWTDATYVVTHRFTGRYVVDAASRRALVGGDGWIGVVLATEARANVEVVDT